MQSDEVQAPSSLRRGAAKKLGWPGLWFLVVFSASAGFVFWTVVRVRELDAELAALNPGKQIHRTSWAEWAPFGFALLIALGLFLRRRFGWAFALAVGAAMLAEMAWLGQTR